MIQSPNPRDVSKFRTAIKHLILIERRIAAPHDAEWLCTTGKEWAGTKIIFKLESAGAKTVLRFTHADWKAETEYFISRNTVWGGLMFRVRSAEGKAPGPLFLANGLGY